MSATDLNAAAALYERLRPGQDHLPPGWSVSVATDGRATLVDHLCRVAGPASRVAAVGAHIAELLSDGVDHAIEHQPDSGPVVASEVEQL